MIFIEKRIFILLLSCIFYFMIYYRRIRGEREIKINYQLEKLLFPFSNEGRAALFSIVMAAYLPIALMISYIVMLVLNVDVYIVNYIWYLCTLGMLFIMGGVDILYELPLMRGGKLLKCIMGIFGFLLMASGIGCMVNSILMWLQEFTWLDIEARL